MNLQRQPDGLVVRGTPLVGVVAGVGRNLENAGGDERAARNREHEAARQRVARPRCDAVFHVDVERRVDVALERDAAFPGRRHNVRAACKHHQDRQHTDRFHRHTSYIANI